MAGCNCVADPEGLACCAMSGSRVDVQPWRTSPVLLLRTGKNARPHDFSAPDLSSSAPAVAFSPRFQLSRGTRIVVVIGHTRNQGFSATLCIEVGSSFYAQGGGETLIDRKSTRLNSSHANISYAVFCL